MKQPQNASGDTRTNEMFVGVECNRTATTVIIRDSGGEYLGRTVGAGASVSGDSVDKAAEMIGETTARALVAVGGRTENVRALYAGVAGVGRDHERFGLWRALTKRDLAPDVVVQPDAAVAMYDAFDDEPGILLIVGGGSIAYGRTSSGEYLRCGGWGAIAGDEGSGAWLGRMLLSEITSMADGRSPMTKLYERVMAELRLANISDLLPWSWSAATNDLAALARVIEPAARDEDPVALRLIADASKRLVLLVTTLVPRIEQSEVNVALSGDWMQPDEMLREAVVAELKRSRAPVSVDENVVVPARGAADLAWHLAQGRALLTRVQYTFAPKSV